MWPERSTTARHAMTTRFRATILRYFYSGSTLRQMEINPIKSEITALRARFDALRGYL